MPTIDTGLGFTSTGSYNVGDTPYMLKGAWLSDDKLYRYSLSRRWGQETAPLYFIMLNPSVADAEKDDNTIRRCVGYAKREGRDAIVVGNLFAFRSTAPKNLLTAVDPVGPENMNWIDALARAAERERAPIVCAWGAHGGYERQDIVAMRCMKMAGANTVCFGTTRQGFPKHPLYLSNAEPLIPYGGRDVEVT